MKPIFAFLKFKNYWSLVFKIKVKAIYLPYKNQKEHSRQILVRKLRN